MNLINLFAIIGFIGIIWIVFVSIIFLKYLWDNKKKKFSTELDKECINNYFKNVHGHEKEYSKDKNGRFEK